MLGRGIVPADGWFCKISRLTEDMIMWHMGDTSEHAKEKDETEVGDFMSPKNL